MLKLTLLAALLVGTAITTLPGQTKQPIEPERTGVELCEEVRYELDIYAEMGGITPDEVTQIVDRCYRHYAK